MKLAVQNLCFACPCWRYCRGFIALRRTRELEHSVWYEVHGKDESEIIAARVDDARLKEVRRR